jgi:ubiquinone biosynthesis protein COQ9
MLDRLAATDLSAMRFRDRIAAAVRLRLEVVNDRELVRRGSTLFSLPQNAAEGAKMIWGTADAIWTALGDTSADINWYSKRATLSAVYGATVLFWLGDDSPGHQATWDFLDRRIDDVMQIEKAKAAIRENPLGKALLAGPGKLMEKFRTPHVPDDLPGRMMDRFR